MLRGRWDHSTTPLRRTASDQRMGSATSRPAHVPRTPGWDNAGVNSPTADRSRSGARSARAAVDRDILRLALPSLGALVAEPLFVMVDSGFVARISTTSLAGLGLASTVLTTVVGLSVFLAYSTTAAVSRAIGAGRRREAISRGVDACWLALLIGTACTALLLVAGPVVLSLFGPSAPVLAEASTYLRVSALGLPAMLAVQAATGLVRGLQDARLPLLVSVGGALLNIPLNAVLIYGLDLGIAGSAIGTVIAQVLMAAVLLAVIARSARTEGVPLRPHPGHVASAGREAVPMLVRTLSLRAVLVVTVLVATGLGEVQLAAHQLASTVFNLLALALDALAIAGQALVGRYLGAAETRTVHAVTRRLMLWGVLGGAAVGALLLAASYVVPELFTPDPDVQRSLRAALWVLVVAQPLAGYVFVLDGVLMGAGDAPYLARAGVVTAAVVMPAAVLVAWWHPAGPLGLAALWAACNLLFLAARAVTLGIRVRGDAWQRTGT